MSFWEYANPRRFMALTDRVIGPAFAIAGIALCLGLIWGFFFTPDDFRQENDVFGSPRLEWKVMHRIKAAMDPDNIFAPGSLPGKV